MNFHSLSANTAILIKFKYNNNIVKNLVDIDKCLNEIDNLPEQKFQVEDINHVLFRCEKEELDITNKKRGNYEIQG